MLRFRSHLPFLALAAAATAGGVMLAPCDASAPAPVTAFIERHCAECHDSDVQKADLNLQDLAFHLSQPGSFRTWQRVFERVRDGEMPPAKQPRPDDAELKSFLASLQQPLLQTDAADIAANGRVRGRRLTRTEYEHTMHDLLGIDIPLKELLPEDRASHGFETVADGQELSHHQLARYLDVADQALDEAFDRALDGDETFRRLCTPADLSRPGGGNYRGPELRDDKSISWPIGLQFTGRMPATEVRRDGWYRITLRGVHAINPRSDGAVWGTLRSGACSSNAPMLFMVGLVEATTTPRDLRYEAWIQRGHMLELRPNDGELRRPPTGAKGGNISYVGRNLAKEGYSGIAHRGIEMERIHPVADRKTVQHRLFGDEAVKQANGDHGAVLDRLVKRFATRAFRRPATDGQVAAYCRIGRDTLAEGKPLIEALRTSYRAILCSPRFLTFVEAPGDLDPHAVASRLSYALWISMPDAALTKLADDGSLRQPAVIARQVERMLDDPKAGRFIRSFTDQWLKLKEIDFTNPDTRQFRDFDAVVQESMLQETRTYVTELLRHDLGVTHLIDSDFAFLNGRLARHYELDEPVEQIRLDHQRGTAKQAGTNGLTRFAVPKGSHRGGLLTQGAILKVTADGTHTSPVVRGVFVNERILGNRIPPPPPGVPAIEPDIRGATSIRDQLDKHRNNASCQSCHMTIDPPGFVLENFDPVGVWRKQYGGKGVGVDPSGVTPDGERFDDLSGWKTIYTRRSEVLAKGFAQQFLTYATGAPIRFSDEAALDEIVSETAPNGHGLRSLIRAAVTSRVFLQK